MTSPGASRLRDAFLAADARFAARKPRERALFALMILAAVGFLIDGVAMRPLERERQDVARESRAHEEQIRNLESQLEALRNPVLDEPERLRRDEIRQLTEQIERIDAGIRNAVARLVPPESAVALLEELLARDDGLELISLRSDPPRRLGPEETEGASTLYRHGITIEIQGDFAATVDYLRRIETSDWEILWDRLEYRVERFPEARIRIELHTLSDEEEWVGV